LSPLNSLNEAHLADPELYKNPMLLWFRGLLRARSRFPEIVENIRNAKQRMEGLERGLVLAKQVLNLLRSHLSHGLWVEYTAYCSQFFGLQMAYESSTLSVLSVSWCDFSVSCVRSTRLFVRHLLKYKY